MAADFEELILLL